MTDRTLQILMPMAGLGSRFAKSGFTLIKPLISVDGMPMFLRALTSLEDIRAAKRYLFVIRKEHADAWKLDQLITAQLPSAEIIILPKVTRGAAETVLMAEPHLNPKDPLIAMDCDLWFRSASYNRMVEESLTGASDSSGGLLTFEADNPRYSYVEVDANENVIRTAEKQVISSHAITGAYYFAQAGIFIDATTKLMKHPLSPQMPEYYLSYVYNVILSQGGKIKATKVDDFVSFGTPEELKAYEDR